MTDLIKREVYYFSEPGAQNTELVVEVVTKRVAAGDIKDVVVASTSGETAVRFVTALEGKANIICVSEAPYRREWGEEWPCLSEENRLKLEQLGAAILDRVPYVFHSSVLEASRWQSPFPESLVKETLYCFGQGMKVAVEVALLAVSCGYLAPYSDVVAIGGCGRGADTAIVLRATYPASLFAQDSTKRLEIKEILAMSISKKWWE